MQYKTIIATLLCAVSALAVNAQSMRLPASHNNLHNDLLANQRPLNKGAKDMASKVLDKDRERLYDNDVYGAYWNSDHVNPYGHDIEIPEIKNIDVSGYVAPVKNVVTSPYGYRARFGRMHRGIDLQLSVGDTVRAAFDGKIRLTKYEGKGYGYYIVARHDNGLETVYGHLSKFLVKPDQYVKAGDPIALGGNTGRSTGPHLHFETRYLGLAINPAAIIDFDNFVTHKDVFTFNKATYAKSQNYAPVKKSSKRSKATASKSKSSKSKAAKKSSKRKRK